MAEKEGGRRIRWGVMTDKGEKEEDSEEAKEAEENEEVKKRVENEARQKNG